MTVETKKKAKSVKNETKPTQAKSFKVKKLTAEDLQSVVGGFNGSFDHPN